ncbi:MAG: hypothetical protein ACI4IF_06850 [Acutalibacteraceae bacterium]
MKIKILSVLMCIIAFLGVLSPIALAAEEATVMPFTVNPEKRVTDITELEEGENPFNFTKQEKERKENRKTMYVAVLCVALVISVIVLVLSLRKIPDEENIELSGKKENGKSEEKNNEKNS